MIRTYLADVSPLLQRNIYDNYYSQVPVWRKKKADRLRYDTDKAQSIGAWTLLDKARSLLGLSEECAFNLSHSGSFVLCSVSSQPGDIKVGCDIETVRKPRLDVAERFFCSSEYIHLSEAATEAERTELFYRFWVLKESFMKATRQGMKLSLQSFEVKFDAEGCPFLNWQPPEFSEKYYYTEFEAFYGAARAAVCTTDVLAADDLEIIVL